MPSVAGRTVTCNRPPRNALGNLIDATTPLRYKVYVGADAATATELFVSEPTTDQRIHMSFQDAQIPYGSYVCIAAIDGMSEGPCGGGVFLPPAQPPGIYLISD